jgi:hypothetical protein
MALLGILVLAIAFTPVSFERNVRYWHAVLAGHLSYAGLPAYDLPTGLLPSWLLQTRWLSVLPQSLSAGDLVPSLVAPLVMLAAIAFAVRRRPALLAAGAVLGVAAVLSYETMSRYQCSYCVDRNLLIVSPLATTLLAVGLALLAASDRISRRVTALGVGLLTLAAVGSQARDVGLVLKNASYMFEPQARAAIEHLPRIPPLGVAMEGFGQTPKAALEDPIVYAAVRYAIDAEPSLPTETSDYQGLQYIGGARHDGTQFSPAYRYVLTRIAGVETGRKTIYRNGPIAVQERLARLDALVTSGVQTAFARADPTGQAWIEGPLTLWVSGTHTRERVWVDVETEVTSSAQVAKSPGMRVRRVGSRLSVCVPAIGTGPLRRVMIGFQPTPVPQPQPPNPQYGIPKPPEGLRLVAVHAQTRACR